jgi:hypothetical protein
MEEDDREIDMMFVVSSRRRDDSSNGFQANGWINSIINPLLEVEYRILPGSRYDNIISMLNNVVPSM